MNTTASEAQQSHGDARRVTTGIKRYLRWMTSASVFLCVSSIR